MSSNDAIVLQSNFGAWKERADDLGKVDPWLYYCLEQFLKPYALDDEETLFGITEGGGDGGADALYFLVNQRQLVTDETTIDAKSVSKVRLVFFQVKQSGGIKPTEIEKWLQLTEDFFDLSKAPTAFGKRYNDKIKLNMQIWRDQYLRIASEFPEIKIDFYYITGGDASPDDYARDSCTRVKTKVEQAIKSKCEIHCVGAKELWEQVQKRPPKSRHLIWAETPMNTIEGAVGLVKLKDFCAFLADDETGEITERIFESNVRGYQDESKVNDGIAKSLKEVGGPNFWLLNNGVTIIAAKAAPAGHRGLSIEDPQIVNGLQTSRVIFGHFKDHKEDDKRTVLVRVIETTDHKTQDRIIRATNSQNRMQPASLRMTDQIHRDIEELFKKVDLFYDRRKGYYRDQGKPIRKIVSVNAVTQAVISILLQRPDDARARPGDYFKDDHRYESAFANTKIPIGAYLGCVQLMQRVERFLDDKKVPTSDEKNLKFYVAALLARNLTWILLPVYQMLPPASKIDEAAIESAYVAVAKDYETLSKTSDKDAVARGGALLQAVTARWKRQVAKQRRGSS